VRSSASTIERLGKTMNIRISEKYRALRICELELTADYLEKRAAETEREAAEREWLGGGGVHQSSHDGEPVSRRAPAVLQRHPAAK
jgi:hypothetical protein